MIIMKRISMLKVMFLICIFIFWNQSLFVEATGIEKDYVTITVDGKSPGTTYAIDTDDPEAFTNSNEFKVPAGTTHTVYIKDAAGNVTTQTYTPTSTTDKSEGEKEVNIDFEVGAENKKNSGIFSNYSYLTDMPLEKGTGTVRNKTTTNGSDTAEKVFYTIQAEDGSTFYMVIDQGAGDNNVYFLNAVTLDDLKSLASASKNEKIKENGGGNKLLSELKADYEDSSDTTKKEKNNSPIYIFMVFAIAAIGIYYYLKKFKQKKNETMDAMDALDMDEFESDEEDEEEVEFEVDDEEKQKYLEQLVDEEETYFDSENQLNNESETQLQNDTSATNVEQQEFYGSYTNEDIDEDELEEDDFED